MRAINRRGVSLVEAIVATTVVGMTVVGALDLVGAQFRLAARAKHTLEAEALATMRLDYLGLMTDAELLSLPDTVEQGTFDPPFDNYSWETISEPSEDQPGLYYVFINILWPEGMYQVKTAAYRRPLVRTVNR